MELIQEIQSDEWWQDVTTGMLENARKRLRDLVRLIDRRKRQPVYTDFEDMRGDESDIELSEFATAETFERYRAKVRAFLKSNENHVAIHKLRRNRPLTETDLAELERMPLESGIGGAADLEKASSRATASASSCAHWSGWTAKRRRRRSLRHGNGPCLDGTA